MPKRTAKKPARVAAPKKRTAAQLHEAARVARRGSKPPEVVRGLLDQAAFAERAEAK